MIVKMFGFDENHRVDSVYVEVPQASLKVIDKLRRDGMITCIGCRQALSVRDRRYTFSQFATDCTKFTFHFICEECVKPVEAAIKEVFNGARAKKQARPPEEKEAAAPACAGGAP